MDQLNDAATGQTRLSDNSRGPKGFGSTPPPSVDSRVVTLIEQIDDTIGQWARSIARNRGCIPSPPINWHRPISEYTYTTKDFSIFLASHVNELAKDLDVGELVASLRKYFKQAIGGREHGGLLNRRTPPQFCGPCPAVITDHRKCQNCEFRPHKCSVRLMSKRGAVEVTCPSCGAVHRVEALVNRLLAGADNYRCTIPEIHRIMRMLGESVSIDRLYKWASPKLGLLRPAGYLRADGRRIGPRRHSKDDKPVYLVADARRVREEKAKPGRRGRPFKEN